MGAMKEKSADWFDGFVTGVSACIMTAQFAEIMADAAPSKKELAEGLVAGMKEALNQARKEFEDSRPS